MSNTIPSTFDENTTDLIQRCHTCKELVTTKQLNPDDERPLATYDKQTYCTLKCMLEPEVMQSTTKES